MTQRVPATPDAVRAPWLQSALTGAGAFADTTILAVESTIIGVGFGLQGTVARLRLKTIGGTPPDSIVVKIGEAERGRNEISFYETIGPRTPVRLPVFHGGIVDEQADRAVLFLEDLSHAVQGDVVRGASVAQAEAVLAVEARFHAFFRGGLEATLPLPGWEKSEDHMVGRLQERTPRFLERYGAILDARAVALVERLSELAPDAIAVLQAAPRTLVHSDLHLDNVLFPAGGEPVILDWTHACRGPAAVDVVRLFVEGITVETRRRYGDALLDGYVEARAAAGSPCLPASRFREEIRAASIWLMAYALSWAGAVDRGFGTPRVQEIVESLVRNTTAAATDLAT